MMNGTNEQQMAMADQESHVATGMETTTLQSTSLDGEPLPVSAVNEQDEEASSLLQQGQQPERVEPSSSSPLTINNGETELLCRHRRSSGDGKEIVPQTVQQEMVAAEDEEGGGGNDAGIAPGSEPGRSIVEAEGLQQFSTTAILSDNETPPIRSGQLNPPASSHIEGRRLQDTDGGAPIVPGSFAAVAASELADGSKNRHPQIAPMEIRKRTRRNKEKDIHSPQLPTHTNVAKAGLRNKQREHQQSTPPPGLRGGDNITESPRPSREVMAPLRGLHKNQQRINQRQHQLGATQTTTEGLVANSEEGALSRDIASGGVPSIHLQAAARGHGEDFALPAVSNTGHQAAISTMDSTQPSPHFSNSHLVEATPINDSMLQIDLIAEEVQENKAIKHKRNDRHDVREQRLRWFVIGLVIVAGTVLAIVFGLKSKSSKEDNELTVSPNETLSVSPSMMHFPSMAPSGSLNLLLEGLPNSTLESLSNISTPQWKARDWLSRHPDLPGMEEWRKIQLFALATFFYAFEGPFWKKEIQEKWLTYELHECYWWSAEFGEFEREDGYTIDEYSFSTDPCNEQEEFQNLYLDQLELSGHAPVIPPEISLLTSLSVLAITDTQINASFDKFIPQDFYQLTHLKYLYFQETQLSGTIPSELALFAGLAEVVLRYNALTGTIPSLIGLLTNMHFLLLHDNSLTGPIPSQIGLASHYVDLYNNFLTGPIPSQIGLAGNLQNAYLSENLLTGSIPSQIGLAGQLRVLHLYGNSFTGLIPSQIGLLSNMKELRVSSNDRLGPLPLEMGDMSNLISLSLADNHISGPIPSELAQISTLTSIRLNRNSFTGTVPKEFEELVLNGNLTLIDVTGNDLSGTIPDGLCVLGRSSYSTGYSEGLGFYCHSDICGCDWCPCPENSEMLLVNSSTTTTNSQNNLTLQPTTQWNGV